MEFQIQPGLAIKGSLIYRERDYAFTFKIDPSLSGECVAVAPASITLDTLQFDIDIDSGRVFYPWGYFPLMKPTVEYGPSPEVEDGHLYVTHDDEFTMGAGHSVPGEWSYGLSPDRKRIVLRNSQYDTISTACRIATGVTVGLSEGSLAQIWLAPIYERSDLTDLAAG